MFDEVEMEIEISQHRKPAGDSHTVAKIVPDTLAPHAPAALFAAKVDSRPQSMRDEHLKHDTARPVLDD